MKINLQNVSFLILVRLDSIQRLENILTVTKLLCRHFNTHIIVWEAAYYKNNLLASLLSKKVTYKYTEDKDPILHKTKYFNLMTKITTTPFLAIWDADIVPQKDIIYDSIKRLEQGMDVVYPYNGECLNVSDIIRNFFIQKPDINFLHRHTGKMNLLYDTVLVGGAVFVNKEKYILAGMENEKHYGWGVDDFERYDRFAGMGFKIFRAEVCLFHLDHPKINSSFNSNQQRRISLKERDKTRFSSRDKLFNKT